MLRCKNILIYVKCNCSFTCTTLDHDRYKIHCIIAALLILNESQQSRELSQLISSSHNFKKVCCSQFCTTKHEIFWACKIVLTADLFGIMLSQFTQIIGPFWEKKTPWRVRGKKLQNFDSMFFARVPLITMKMISMKRCLISLKYNALNYHLSSCNYRSPSEMKDESHPLEITINEPPFGK